MNESKPQVRREIVFLVEKITNKPRFSDEVTILSQKHCAEYPSLEDHPLYEHIKKDVDAWIKKKKVGSNGHR